MQLLTLKITSGRISWPLCEVGEDIWQAWKGEHIYDKLWKVKNKTKQQKPKTVNVTFGRSTRFWLKCMHITCSEFQKNSLNLIKSLIQPLTRWQHHMKWIFLFHCTKSRFSVSAAFWTGCFIPRWADLSVTRYPKVTYSMTLPPCKSCHTFEICTPSVWDTALREDLGSRGEDKFISFDCSFLRLLTCH